MKLSFLLSGVPVLLWAAVAQAQGGHWSVQLELGADRYWGGSMEIAEPHRSFRPYRPTVFGIGVGRSGNRVGAAVQLRYLEAALGLEGEGAVAAVEGVFQVVSLAPELTYRVATLGPAVELRLHAGPLLELWELVDEDTKTHLGAQGALSLDFPLGGRFAGSVLTGIGVTPSPFEAAQLGSEFQTRGLWRRRVAGALSYRL